MSILDQPDRWHALDPQGMRFLIEKMPDQVREAAGRLPQLEPAVAKRVRNLVVTGLGGSAIGGDVVRCVLGDSLPVPLLVNRDYKLPAFVGRGTLVVACSYSGETEETVAAYQEARRAGAAILCVTSGGRLAEMARTDGNPVVTLPAGLPPRAALGYSSILLLGTLHGLGPAWDCAEALEETVALLERLSARCAASAPEAENPAKLLAAKLAGRVVAVYASSGLLEAAAARWRGQLEENAKNLAFHHLLPEMNHNELVGWNCPASVLKQIAVVFLRDAGDHPHVQRRFDLTREALAPRAGGIHEVWSEGRSLLARIFSVLYFGDFVSLFLAILNGVDPTPVEAIETFKMKLRAE